jgi:threonylcarbamoyladenosine tRNA methylthiotransferase MtaB
MRRRYTTAQFAGRIEQIRARMPHAGIGADVIVGFPGESDGHFETTHRFLADLPVSYLHVFTYSERLETAALNLEGRVEPRVRFSRNDALRVLGRIKKDAFLRSLVGSTQDVLAEAEVHGEYRFGFTPTYARVALPADGARGNEIVRVEITGVEEEHCMSRIAEVMA